MKGLAGTLILVLLLGGLGAALWFSEQGRDEAEEAPTESVLGGRSIANARSLVVQRDPTGFAVELERGPDGLWRVVEPVRDLASPAVLEAIASAYDAARLVPAFPDEQLTPEMLEETGLSEPRASLVVRWADGEEIEIELGLAGPLGRDLFARRDGEIWRVDQSLLNALQFNPDDARDPHVFRNLPAQAHRLKLTRWTDAGEREALTLERRGAQPWAMVEPASLRVDQHRVQAFLGALLGMRIDRFLRGRPSELSPPAPATDPNPDAILEIEGMLGPERVVLWRVPDTAALVGESDARATWFSIEERDFEALVETPLLALRAHWLLSHPVTEAERIRVEHPGGSAFELVRRPGEPFRITQPIQADTWPTAAAELLQALRSLGVHEFVEDDATDLQKYGLAGGHLVLSLHADRWRGSDVLHIGADRGDGLTWLRRADEPHVVAIPTALAETIRRPFLDYVDRVIASVDAPSAVREVVHQRGGETVTFVRDEQGHWRRSESTEREPLVDEIVDLMVGLTAERVLPPQAWAPVESARITLRGVGGRELVTIEVGRDEDGRFLARTPRDEGVVFELKRRDGSDLLELR